MPGHLHAYTFVGCVVSLLDVLAVRLRRFLLAARGTRPKAGSSA